MKHSPPLPTCLLSDPLMRAAEMDSCGVFFHYFPIPVFTFPLSYHPPLPALIASQLLTFLPYPTPFKPASLLFTHSSPEICPAQHQKSCAFFPLLFNLLASPLHYFSDVGCERLITLSCFFHFLEAFSSPPIDDFRSYL